MSSKEANPIHGQLAAIKLHNSPGQTSLMYRPGALSAIKEKNKIPPKK
ncbi:MAG: hypothetical protein V1697_02650 [Candidatus Levyibacteriota bacterium]